MYHFRYLLPSSPWDSWNSQQDTENMGVSLFLRLWLWCCSGQVSTVALCNPQPQQLSRILERKRDFHPQESNLKYVSVFYCILIDNFIYLLLEDLPKSLFPFGNRHGKSRKKKGKVLLLHRLISQPVFCKGLQGIKQCTQGLRPLQATEELGASGHRNQRFLSRNL